MELRNIKHKIQNHNNIVKANSRKVSVISNYFYINQFPFAIYFQSGAQLYKSGSLHSSHLSIYCIVKSTSKGYRTYLLLLRNQQLPSIQCRSPFATRLLCRHESPYKAYKRQGRGTTGQQIPPKPKTTLSITLPSC